MDVATTKNNLEWTFSTMLHKAKKLNLDGERGELKGQCCICGIQTEYGHKKKFGASFTSYNYLIKTGTVICEYCIYLKKNSNELRRTMYLLTEKEFHTFKKDQAQEIILNIHEKVDNQDYYLYITNTWQKLGWVRMREAINHNTDNMKIVWDYDLIITSLDELKQYWDLIDPLRELKISKNRLSNGQLGAKDMMKIRDECGVKKSEEIRRKLYVWSGSHQWDLALYITK
jgi:hypothetical protein